MSENDTRFKKGQSGNPNGRPRIPEDLKMARRLNKLELEKLLNQFLFMTPPEMEERVKSADVTAIEAMIGSIIIKAVKDGDQQRLNFILERLIGKVKDQIDLTVVKPFIIKRPSGEIVEMGVEAQIEGQDGSRDSDED